MTENAPAWRDGGKSSVSWAHNLEEMRYQTLALAAWLWRLFLGEAAVR